jgi:hypothetical protein
MATGAPRLIRIARASGWKAFVGHRIVGRFFTFEMERRGADVTAIDYVDLDTFRELHGTFGSRARYESLDVYELDPKRNGVFDIVLRLGVLYHLKHPLLALERICAVTRELCILETFVVDGEAWQQGIRPPLPFIEFYEGEELGGQWTTGPGRQWARWRRWCARPVLRMPSEVAG